jgi:hypothetical protein
MERRVRQVRNPDRVWLWNAGSTRQSEATLRTLGICELGAGDIFSETSFSPVDGLHGEALTSRGGRESLIESDDLQ